MLYLYIYDNYNKDYLNFFFLGDRKCKENGCDYNLYLILDILECLCLFIFFFVVGCWVLVDKMKLNRINVISFYICRI